MLNKKLRIFFKGLVILIILLILMGFIISKYARVKSNYKCTGAVTRDNKTQNKELYFTLNEYRFWYGIWIESDGNLWIEMVGHTPEYFADVRDNDHYLYFTKFDNIEDGNFSKLSKHLSLKTYAGLFEGECSKITNDN